MTESAFEIAKPTPDISRGAPESVYAWARLWAALLLSAIGGVGMWSVIVALSAVQAEFGVARSGASLPYTMTMICFGFGGILMGRLSDRFGIFVPVVGGAVGRGVGHLAASQATSLWQFALAQGLLVGVASSVAFAPIIADTSLWFTRHRGMEVAIIASGSYVAGAVWPPVVQHFIERGDWRSTYQGIALVCVAVMLPLALVLRRRSPLNEMTSATPRPHRRAAHAAPGFEVASASPGPLPALRRTCHAVHLVGAVRPRPGWHRALLCRHRSRVLPSRRGQGACQHCADGHGVRHGAGRLALWRDLRPHRFLPGRLPQRHRLEPLESRHRRGAAAAARPAARASTVVDRSCRGISRRRCFRVKSG